MNLLKMSLFLSLAVFFLLAVGPVLGQDEEAEEDEGGCEEVCADAEAAPVCGKDGVTRASACLAECQGEVSALIL